MNPRVSIKCWETVEWLHNRWPPSGASYSNESELILVDSQVLCVVSPVLGAMDQFLGGVDCCRSLLKTRLLFSTKYICM
jgi:hypothetical protein